MLIVTLKNITLFHKLYLSSFEFSDGGFKHLNKVIQGVNELESNECTFTSNTLYLQVRQGLTLIDVSFFVVKFVDAVEMYREVMRSVEEHKDRLRTDDLQQLHAMYNLDEILQTKPEGVQPTLRDGQLKEQVKKSVLQTIMPFIFNKHNSCPYVTNNQI